MGANAAGEKSAGSAWRALCAAALAAALGCGGAGGGPADGGSDGDAWGGMGSIVVDVAPPAPPDLTPCPAGWVEGEPVGSEGVPTCEPWPGGDPAALPTLTPCPAGWREVGGTPATCEPWPEGGPSECALDEAQLPGDPACARVGSACPAGEWAEGIPEGSRVLHVRAGAPGGGAGTIAAPFGTVGEATAAAAPGTVIALSRGTFDEVVSLPAGVTLWGACVAETALASSTPDEGSGTVLVDAEGAVVRNLRVEGRRQGVRVTGPGSSLHLEDVVVRGAVSLGVRVADGARLTARNLVVRETVAASDGRFGRGLQAHGGAAVEAERVLIDGNRDVGVVSSEAGTTVRLQDVAIRRTAARAADHTLGRGAHVQLGGLLELTRAAVEENRDAGLFVADAASRLVLEDGVVRDTRPQESDGTGGAGLAARSGGPLEARRVLVEESRGSSVFAAGDGSRITLDDVVVRDTRPAPEGGLSGYGVMVREAAALDARRLLLDQSRTAGLLVVAASAAVSDLVVRQTAFQEADGRFGYGLEADEGARVEARRAVLEGNRTAGLFASGAATEVDLEDLVVRGTLPRPGSESANGHGLEASEGARVAVTRGLFDRNTTAGLVAGSPGTSLELTDVVVRGTLRWEDGDRGDGIAARDGAALTVSRVLLDGNQGYGLLATGAEGPVEVTATDLVARDTGPREVDGLGGVALCFYDGASLDLERGLLTASRGSAIVADGAGVVLRLADVAVEDTESLREPGRPFGRGLTAQDGAAVEVTRGLFDRNREVGVVADGEGTTVELEDVEVRETRGTELEGADGTGLAAQWGARVRAERVRLLRNRDVGLFVGGEAAELDALELEVLETAAQECAATTCEGAGSGAGLAVVLDGHAELTLFVLGQSAQAGAILARGGTADLHEGEVSGNPVGVNVQTEGFDLGRLQDRVRYVANGRDLDASSLPLPEPIDPSP